MEHVFGASGKRGCERRPAPKGSPRIGCTLPAITEYQNRPKTERKSQKTERKLFRALCGPTVNFQRLNTACSVTYINGSRSASIELLWTTPRSSVSMRCGRRAPLGLRVFCSSYLTRTALRFGRCLLSHHMSFCGAALLMLSAHWFPSGKEGQLPTTGWFRAGRIRTRGVR